MSDESAKQRHVVICGAGETGYQLARELAPIQDIYVIDTQSQALGRFDKLDVQTLSGSAVEMETLNQARVPDAGTFIACTGSDEVNIIACLTAKRLHGGVRTICFVDKREYVKTFGELTGGGWAIDRLVWADQLLAVDIAKVVSVPEAIDVESLAGGALRLLEYRIREGSSLLGRPVYKLNLPKQVLAVALIRDGELMIPHGDTSFAVGDKVVFIGHRDYMFALEQRVSRRFREKQDVVIIGGGNVGFLLARTLQNADCRIRIIEANADRCNEIAPLLDDSLVLLGDGTNLELLEEEQISSADVLVAVTNNDEKNLLVSLLAKRLGVDKTITRVNSSTNTILFEKVGIDVALDPRASAVRDIVHQITSSGTELVAVLDEGNGEVIEVDVPAWFDKKRVMDMRTPESSLIVAVTHSGRTIVPKGETTVEAGDQVMFVCARGTEGEIRRLFDRQQ